MKTNSLINLLVADRFLDCFTPIDYCVHYEWDLDAFTDVYSIKEYDPKFFVKERMDESYRRLVKFQKMNFECFEI